MTDGTSKLQEGSDAEARRRAADLWRRRNARMANLVGGIFNRWTVVETLPGSLVLVDDGDPETEPFEIELPRSIQVDPGDVVVSARINKVETVILNMSRLLVIPEPPEAGPTLPPGGAAGAVLKKASSADGDAVWEIEPSTGAIVGVAESTSFTPTTWSTTSGMPSGGWPALTFNTPTLEAGIEYVATIIVFVEMFGSINASAGKLYVSIDGTTTVSPEITTEGNVNAPKIQVHSAIRTGSGASIPIAVRWQYITGAAAVPEWAKAIVTLIPKSKVGGGGGGGSVSWGAISGSIASQSDLQSELNLKANSSALSSHTGDMANPHGVTKAQVGLGSVDNTSDAAKPVSTAQQTALNLKLNTSDAPELIRDTMGAALVAGANVTITVNDAGDTITIASLGGGGGGSVSWGAITGTLSAQTDLQAALNDKANSSALTSHTSSTSNPHAVTKAQVGLGSVDNTSDAAKPVSTATQTALNGKAPVVHTHTLEEVLQIRVYNGGAVIPSDIVGDVIIPYNCSPVGWTMVTPEVSTAIVELWKDTLANYPPTSLDKVSSTNRINTAASKYGQSSVMTGWNVTWVKDEILRVYVDSNDVAKEMLINVYLTRTI